MRQGGSQDARTICRAARVAVCRPSRRRGGSGKAEPEALGRRQGSRRLPSVDDCGAAGLLQAARTRRRDQRFPIRQQGGRSAGRRQHGYRLRGLRTHHLHGGEGLPPEGRRAAGKLVRPCGCDPERQSARLPRAHRPEGHEKIGVTGPGSASAMGLRMVLSKASLTADDVAIIGVGGGPGAVAAVKTGKLDAIANFDPAISLLERDGAIKVILDTRKQQDLEYLYGGPFAASAFYLDARFAARNPKTVQAFVNAVSAALDWLNKASTDEIVAAVPPEYYAGDRALYRTMIESNRERVSPDGRISAEAAQITLRNLTTFEDTLKTAKIDLASTYDNAFVERARSLGAK